MVGKFSLKVPKIFVGSNLYCLARVDPPQENGVRNDNFTEKSAKQKRSGEEK